MNGGPGGGPGPDLRRRLQLGLAGLWLFDSVLQFQGGMFGPGLAHMTGAAAHGNPGPVAAPIIWTAHLIALHPGAADTAVATGQLLLALGIAWRPAVKPALAASIAWSAAIWWLGEGLGGVLTPEANPVTGAPGAVIVYALLAVLLWPGSRGGPAARIAGPAAGPRTAAALWAALWGGMALLAARSATQAPRALPAQLAALAPGQPHWVAAMSSLATGWFARWGTPTCLALALLYAVVAVGAAWPSRAVRPSARLRASLVLAMLVSLATWAVGQDFGGVFTGMSTDPNSGPLLVLLALAYWPATPAPAPATGPVTGLAAAESAPAAGRTA